MKLTWAKVLHQVARERPLKAADKRCGGRHTQLLHDACGEGWAHTLLLVFSTAHDKQHSTFNQDRAARGGVVDEFQTGLQSGSVAKAGS